MTGQLVTADDLAAMRAEIDGLREQLRQLARAEEIIRRANERREWQPWASARPRGHLTVVRLPASA